VSEAGSKRIGVFGPVDQPGGTTGIPQVLVFVQQVRKIVRNVLDKVYAFGSDRSYESNHRIAWKTRAEFVIEKSFLDGIERSEYDGCIAKSQRRKIRLPVLDDAADKVDGFFAQPRRIVIPD